MLAQNFKSAEELGIKEVEVRSLAKVLVMLECGEIPQEHFHMGTTGDWKGDWWTNPALECKTPACICGWARHISGVTPRLFNNIDKTPIGLRNLFQMSGDMSDGYPRDVTSVEEAAIALRSYLTTGRPVWGDKD